jgi:ferric-dicitrate binding protein FerR (iron transport regulator)
VSPEENGRYEVDLQLGTVSALLDPMRDKDKDPAFAIRGSGGVTEATGTFYAVTEYKGQTYSAVKKGTVKKKTVPPAKPDFAAYLKKAKSKTNDGKSSK